MFGLDDMSLLEMGDFAGAVLKYVRRNPVDRLSLVGGFGKLSKLADGHLDLHSRSSSVDFNQLARLAESNSDTLSASIEQCNTSAQVLELCEGAGIPIGNRVCEKAMTTIKKYTNTDTQVEAIAIDRNGNVVGRAS